jgi:Ca-activated chloride channel family protein
MAVGVLVACGDESSVGIERGDGTDSTDMTDGTDATDGTDSGGMGPPPDPNTGGNTNVNFGGAQDFGFIRQLLDNDLIPRPEDFVDTGFFAEHQTPLPQPMCGERICVQGMLGVMDNIFNGEPCLLLQVGLNSPIRIDGRDSYPLSLSLVVDVSGSMTGEKLNFVLLGLRRMINELSDSDRVALITYSDRATVEHPLAPVGGNRNTLNDILDRLGANGGTNLWAGLEAGYRQLADQRLEGHNHRVILLSDGQPTVGLTNAQAIVDRSAPYNSEGTGLTTIGLGTDFNQDLMLDLAEQADGNAYFIENLAALDEVFTEELAYFTLAVARDLELEVRMDDNFRIVQAYGAPRFDFTASRGDLSVPSVFLAHRRSPDDVTPDGGRRGGGSALLMELMPNLSEGPEPAQTDVATLHATFIDPTTGEVAEDDLTVSYPFAPSVVLDSGYFENDIVTKSFVMLNIFVGMQQAAAEFHDGRPTDGLAIIERLLAAVIDYNEEVDDTDIEFDIELLGQMRDVMIALNTPPPPPEAVPEDPWPAD